MKQNCKHQHDTQQAALLRQFLEELEPGVQEYDRIMARRENPGAAHTERRFIIRYAAAACLLAAAFALALIMWPAEGPGGERQMAQKEVAKKTLTHTEKVPVQVLTPKGQEVLETQEKQEVLQSVRCPQKRAATAQRQEAPPAEESVQEEAPAGIPGDAWQATEELKEQVEAEVMRKLLERHLGMEVVKTALRMNEDSQPIHYAI